MSDRDPGKDRPDGAGGREEEGSDSDERSFGLTEEFSRLEAEIEKELGSAGEDPGEPGDPDPGSKDTEAEPPSEEISTSRKPGEVRFDETDSSEWVAPAEKPRRETDEWAAAGEGAFAEAEAAAGSKPATDDEPGNDAPDEGDDPAADEITTVSRPDAEDDPEPAVAASATEHTVVSPRPLAGVGAGGYGGGGGGYGAQVTDDDLADVKKTPTLWMRFLAGSVVIVAAVATAVSVSTLLFLTDVAADLRPIPGIQDKLNTVEPGEPQTILILGSDKRPTDDTARSDTTMLLRLDPDNKVLSLFSLPRDLKVPIPGVSSGTKLNEAYSAGGPELTLETVKELTGLEINHVVNVNFQGFADAVDAIECVYVDVDRDYFNDNSTAFSEAEQYAEIDINAGYQRLCGLKALQYVRYRHTDTDLVRAARQQDFLREARQKIQPKELLFNGSGNDLIDIFTKYTKSDVNDATQVVGILRSFISVRDVPINEIHFDGDIGPSFVTASQSQIDKAVEQFLGDQASKGGRGGDDAASEEGAAEIEDKPKKKPKKESSEDVTESADVVDADPGVVRFAKTSDRRLKFPVYFPTKLAAKDADASIYDAGSRQYEIKDQDNNKHAAYKLVVQYTSPDVVPEYYGVEGTQWENPPILENPSETRIIDDREYELFYDGDRLRMVAWRDGGNSYWVNNTLLQTLDEDQMLAIAASTKKEDS